MLFIEQNLYMLSVGIILIIESQNVLGTSGIGMDSTSPWDKESLYKKIFKIVGGLTGIEEACYHIVKHPLR